VRVQTFNHQLMYLARLRVEEMYHCILQLISLLFSDKLYLFLMKFVFVDNLFQKRYLQITPSLSGCYFLKITVLILV
jgi:hypothetical protein